MKQKKMSKKEMDRRLDELSKELLELYKKSMPVLIKSWNEPLTIPREKQKLIKKILGIDKKNKK